MTSEVNVAAAGAEPGEGVGHDRLKRLMKRGTDFLGCEVAIMGGAMSWISERHWSPQSPMRGASE
jgi:hypothetical protein